MSKNKVKDAGPEGHKPLPKFDAGEDDVEGHKQHLPKYDAGPEGHKPLPKYEGTDDDVEGHKQKLPL